MLCCVCRHDKCKLGIHMDGKELLLHTLQNQYLLEKGGRMDILSGLCGLQAQFAGNPRHSLRIRARDFSEDGWSAGLLKIWTHRNTIHVIRPGSSLTGPPSSGKKWRRGLMEERH